ncbi:hypothetical protein BCON_0314g00140 [Botryotinia convoluta]|uniref:Uncharacterized protein n=1 Tax=Botryotinia convoluta TaxID=54673 RepID=A0A4Z1HH58_9HELO|nr:hypothetical protein BCON_0314g00140 [Botryotinia convoluta]
MAYQNTGSQCMRQTRAGQSHRHQVIDVEELMNKGGGVPEPGCHDVLNLTKLLERTINVSSRVIDSAFGRKRTALDWLRDRSPFPDNYTFPAHYGRLQPHLPSSSHDPATEVDLTWLFSIFNIIFFMSAPPHNTRIFQQNSSFFVLKYRVSVSERAGVIVAISINSTDANVNVGFKERVDHRGEAWQIIAYRFEKSSTMRHTPEPLGSPINWRKKEDYEWELHHWDLRDLDKLEDMLLRRMIETWGWAPDSQLSCVKAIQKRKRNRAIARDEERRALNEFIRSRSGTRGTRFEVMEFRFGGPRPLFVERVSPFGVGGSGLEGISEEVEPRSRGPETRTEAGESRYGGSESRSREAGSCFERRSGRRE